MRVMIVDDEADIREILSFNLSAAGYDTIECGTAEAALIQIRKGTVPDIILLDVMLPGMSGFKLADKIRKEDGCNVPIIFLTARNAENDLLTGFSAGGDDYISMLTAKGEEIDRILGLELGADDYIAKPFDSNELIARIKAVLKRTGKVCMKSIVLGGVIIDTTNMNVTADGAPVPLSRKEYDILLLLASHPGMTFSRADLIRELWKDAPYVLDRTVDVHIARIRSKLGTCRDLVTNRAGFGYSMEAHE